MIFAYFIRANHPNLHILVSEENLFLFKQTFLQPDPHFPWKIGVVGLETVLSAFILVELIFLNDLSSSLSFFEGVVWQLRLRWLLAIVEKLPDKIAIGWCFAGLVGGVFLGEILGAAYLRVIVAGDYIIEPVIRTLLFQTIRVLHVPEVFHRCYVLDHPHFVLPPLMVLSILSDLSLHVFHSLPQHLVFLFEELIFFPVVLKIFLIFLQPILQNLHFHISFLIVIGEWFVLQVLLFFQLLQLIPQ